MAASGCSVAAVDVGGVELGAGEQGDEADEAGASDGASQLIPGVRRTNPGVHARREVLAYLG
jgi:hypothetical protein